ncbi:MAG: KOW domain-containing RNA-binding protein [Lachnospiraceae bacterium]|jgi:ribosomal protein L14E/L6E/L27E|nr:KOW domain-containing RNA-binding protein [Lachnospiraceae bacterium]
MKGLFAESLAGHDKGQVYVIVGAEGAYAYVADGRLKRIEKPKRKNIKHLQVMKAKCDEGLREKLQNGQAVTNEEIKYSIKRNFKCQNPT